MSSEKELWNKIEGVIDARFGGDASAAAEFTNLLDQYVQARTKLIGDKFKQLEFGIFAIKPLLDKPYPDDPRWTPYSRFIHPREIMVRAALEGENIGELEGMARAARANPIEKEKIDELDNLPLSQLRYGTHVIPTDWQKIDNVYVWFRALASKHRLNWRGIPGYVYKRPDGSFVAPFRGDLLPVIQDGKDEFREISDSNPIDKEKNT